MENRDLLNHEVSACLEAKKILVMLKELREQCFAKKLGENGFLKAEKTVNSFILPSYSGDGKIPLRGSCLLTVGLRNYRNKERSIQLFQQLCQGTLNHKT